MSKKIAVSLTEKQLDYIWDVMQNRIDSGWSSRIPRTIIDLLANACSAQHAKKYPAKEPAIDLLHAGKA